MPAVIVFFAVLPTYFASQQSDAPLTVAVYDTSGLFVSGLRARLSREETGRPIQLLDMTASGNSFQEEASSLVSKGVIHGFVILGKKTLDDGWLPFYAMDLVEESDLARLERALEGVSLELDLTQMGMNQSTVKQLSQPVHLDLVRIAHSGPTALHQYLAGLVSVMMLFFAIFNSGGGFMRGLLEEKSGKVIEILASSVEPSELMAGKLVGMGLIGLFQLGLWFLVGAIFGSSSLTLFVSWPMVGFVIIYFVLGYLFFASVFSILGALFSTDHDIQHLQGLIAFIGILPLAFAFLVLGDPDSLLVNMLSYIPPLTPTLMILRLAVSDPPWLHLAGTIAVMGLSIGLALRMAGYVFKMQMTGRRITWPKIPSSRQTLT